MERRVQIDACKQGDRKALGDLYTAYSRKLLGICRHYVKDEAAAEDILHDAFIIIFSSISTLKDDSKLEGWMITIVRNLSLKYLQNAEKRAASLSLIHADTLLDEPDHSGEEVELDTLMAAIESLPHGNREVFKLSVLDGLSHQEIGELLGIAPHSSSSQLSRAKKMLRTMLVHYWMLFLLPVLIPLYLYFVARHEPENVSESRPAVVKPRRESDGMPEKEGAGEGLKARGYVRIPTVHRGDDAVSDTEKDKSDVMDEQIRTDRSETERRLAAAPAGSLRRRLVAGIPAADTLFRLPEIPSDRLMALDMKAAARPKKKYPWAINFGYSSDPATSSALSMLDYLSVVDYANGGVAAKLYNWNDYMAYVERNSLLMDSLERARLNAIAVNNFTSGSEALNERVHHFRPVTYGLSLSRQLSPHWIFGTGLSYTRLKSVSESEFGKAMLRKTQKIDYVGIPFRLTYRLWGKGRFHAYTTGGFTFELPVHSSLRQEYIVTPDSSFTLRDAIHPRWQWSVNIGVGVQYRIVKPFSFYIEPNLYYYFRNGSALETWRIEHPFVLTVPFGFRLTW